MIKKVRIKTIRSIADATLELGPLNVVVGPNGAGKSSILGAFEIVREYARRGQEALPEIARATGALDSKRKSVFPPVEIEMEGLVRDSTDVERQYSYIVQFSNPRGAFSQTSRESFRYVDGSEPRSLLEYPTPQGPGMAQFYNEDGSIGMGIGFGGGNMSPLGMAAQQLTDSGISQFAREVLSWENLSAAPQFSKNADDARHQSRLDPYGTNLSGLLMSIHSEDSGSFERIISTLKSAVPEIESVQVPVTAEGKTYIELREAGVKSALPIWALSDGTVSLLQLFTLLERTNPPPLICIDEPENYVHPGLMEIIVASIRRAAEKSQVVVATHSPHLLNFLKPSELFIVEKSKGVSRVRPATNQQGIVEAVKLLGLGDLWKSGGIGGVP